MNNGILIIAHTPLASALRACALHVFPDSASKIEAVDVMPNTPPEVTLNAARAAQARLGLPNTLVHRHIWCHALQHRAKADRWREVATDRRGEPAHAGTHPDLPA